MRPTSPYYTPHATLSHPALPIASLPQALHPILPYPFCPTLRDATLYPTLPYRKPSLLLSPSTLYTLTQSTRSPHTILLMMRLTSQLYNPSRTCITANRRSFINGYHYMASPIPLTPFSAASGEGGYITHLVRKSVGKLQGVVELKHLLKKNAGRLGQ